jgi:proteasome-associated ATPase
MLGKALATSLATHYGTNVSSFFYVKGPELLSQFVGVAEQNIRNLFSTARAFFKENGFPPVIFIDEAESILSRRGSGKSSDVEKTIVPQFLTEMDGITESNVIVVLASNRPDMIDSAILREGRIDKKIRIDNPDMETARAIIALNLKRTSLADPMGSVENSFIDEIFSERYPLYEVYTEREEKMLLHLRDITSGATLANIVSSSISNAINRDIRDKVKKATGIRCEDAVYAVNNLYEQHKGYKHIEQLDHFAEVHDIRIKKVTKIK